MKKSIITIAIIVVAAIAGLSVYSINNVPKNKNNVQPTTTQQADQIKKIKYSNGGKTVAYTGVVDKTALATLKSLTSVKTKTSSYGEMVTGINDISADSKTEYWAFYVNGKLASEGAGTYKAVNGDKIEWRLEKL